MERFLCSTVCILSGRNSCDKGAVPLQKHYSHACVCILTLNQVKHDVKARLTLSSSGASGGEGPRTHIQVLANSIVASVLILLHYRQLRAREAIQDADIDCWPYGEDLLVVGIVRYSEVCSSVTS